MSISSNRLIECRLCEHEDQALEDNRLLALLSTTHPMGSATGQGRVLGLVSIKHDSYRS